MLDGAALPERERKTLAPAALPWWKVVGRVDPAEPGAGRCGSESAGAGLAEVGEAGPRPWLEVAGTPRVVVNGAAAAGRSVWTAARAADGGKG